MTEITLYNARTLLVEQRLIKLCPDYSDRSGRFFFIDTPITVRLSTGYRLVIDTEYRTDLSSVPRWLWSVASPYGPFLLAALIHDYLYSKNIGTRDAADREMLLWSVVLHDNQSDNFIRYKAVQWFGRGWWRKAARRIEAEKLVLQTQA